MGDIIELSLDEWLTIHYNYTFIESTLFSNDINFHIKNYIENRENFDFAFSFDMLYKYICTNCDENVFDNFVKSNAYILADYFYSHDNISSKKEKTEMLNKIKICLNSLENNNYYFLRDQIALRKFGLKYTDKSFKLKALKVTKDEYLEELKPIYYASIANDINLLILLMEQSDQFYNDDYKILMLNKNFYRSVNYFLLTNEVMFSANDNLAKIKYIIEQNLNYIFKSGEDINQDCIDDEFLDIANVTTCLIKKYEKKLNKGKRQ